MTQEAQRSMPAGFLAPALPRPRTRARRTSLPDPVRWHDRYGLYLVALDATVAIGAAGLAGLFRWSSVDVEHEAAATVSLVVVLPLLWVSAMLLCRAYEDRFLGVGSEEFRRVVIAAVGVVALVGTASWAFRLDIARGYVVLALPTATVGTLVARYLLRKELHRRRIRGECRSRVVVAGHTASVGAMVTTMRRASYHGMEVVAACTPAGRGSNGLAHLEVPVEGSLDEIADVVARLDADIVTVLGCPELDGAALRRLGWQLESTRAELLVAPGVTEVVGPRVAIRPVCGLPLLHVERPELSGVRRVGKAVFDRSVAALALLLLSPLLVAIAVTVASDSRGSVIFRQRRVGVGGREFTMLKFRTMHPGAHAQVGELKVINEGNHILFKLKNDPRITRVGRSLRKYSMDELPQLFNVLRGDMSLVGPRPPLPAEVAQYGEHVWRRLLVKPGLTGLWQISGRSDLDWDESLRLDLRYVENWSFAFDLMILWKTVAAVVHGRGAY